MQERRTAVVVAVLSGLQLTCSPPYALWMEPGSTNERIVFRHATKRHGHKAYQLALVEVTSCRAFTTDLRKLPQDTFWLARAPEFPGDKTVIDNTIVYAKSIPNLLDSIGPKPLDQGCYHIWVHAGIGTASLDFWVLGDGTARELTASERDSAFTIGARHGRAELQADEEATAFCREAYLKAGLDTGATAAVDSIIPYDTARFAPLTCATLRRVDPRRTDPTYSPPNRGGA